ncbi:ABC transporter permease [Kitasatospora sp. GAS1066B]|uniref:ABC transporter permease n=1 Tax=Kitasatospora sp. GAS1066B TaxID=3156271 RepID=UPI003511F82C
MTITVDSLSPAATAAAAVAEPRARFRDLLAAEWTKLWSLRSIHWALAATVLAILAANANAARSDLANYPNYSAEVKNYWFVPYWAMRDAFTNNSAWIVALAAGGIGAIAIVGEYSTGMIRTTFAAVPARRSVLAAKVAVLTGLMLVAGAVMAFGSFWLTQAILSHRHIGISISQPGALRCVIASALFPVVCALIGFGLGALIKHSATTVIATVGVLLLLPNLFNSPDKRWICDLHNLMPIAAWERLAFIGGRQQLFGPYPATITGSWLTYLIWPLVAVLLPLLLVRRRDL